MKIALFYILISGLGIALIRDTAYQGQDFEVFWKAGLNLREGLPLYSLERDGAMVFKYPPWIATLFLPFSFVPLSFAKWIWGIIQVASLAYLIRSFFILGVPAVRLWVITLSFWGVWAVHALDGQIMLPVLALLWWTGIGARKRMKDAFFLALSTVKGTTALVWFHPLTEARSKREKILFLMSGFGLLVFLFLPFTFDDLHSWWKAANSGDASFGLEKILGRENQSFTALIQRLIFSTGGNPSGWGLPIAGILGFVSGAAWWKYSRTFKTEEKLAGWLALVPLIHPLSWIHTFTWAYPLAMISFPVGNKKRDQLIYILGIGFLCLFTEKTLEIYGLQLEMLSIKSWGVLLLFYSVLFKVRN